jgi:DNA-binding transcriptional MerR regulator
MVGRTLSIGEAARASGLPVKTIRYYEEIGLIPPARRTNGEGQGASHRIYGDADIGRLGFIHHARLLGLSLGDIRQLLALAEDKGCPSRQPEYRKILGRHLQVIDERVCHLLGLRAAIESLMPARRTKATECAWDTCACMKPAQRTSLISARSSARRRSKGTNHV